MTLFRHSRHANTYVAKPLFTLEGAVISRFYGTRYSLDSRLDFWAWFCAACTYLVNEIKKTKKTPSAANTERNRRDYPRPSIPVGVGVNLSPPAPSSSLQLQLPPIITASICPLYFNHLVIVNINHLFT